MRAAEHLAANLILLRSLQNKSLVAFAGELGIAKSTLQEIERGHSPNLDTAEQIARSLDLPLPLLLAGSLPPSQSDLLPALLREVGWFSRWPEEEQREFLRLLLPLLDLYARHITPK